MNTTSRKIRVLLVVPNLHQAIGNMAKYIATSATNIDFYYFNMNDIRRTPRRFYYFTQRVDVIHWLSYLNFVELPNSFDITNLATPNIATIHHVDLNASNLDEEDKKISAASRCNLIHVYANEWKVFVERETTIPVYLAHQVINLNQFKRNQNVSRPRNPLRLGAFGFSNELKGRKRLDVLLDALIILRKNNYNFDLVVQGPYWEKFQPLFKENGIRVINLGYIPSWLIAKSYRYIDLYICSSDVEGGPLTVLEALASGVPVISTKVGIAIDALSLGGGMLVKKGCPSELAFAIGKILDDPGLYKRLSKEAVEVANNFTWDKVGIDYISMYNIAIKSKNFVTRNNRMLLNSKIQRTLELIINLYRERNYLKDALKDRMFLKLIFNRSISD